MMIKKFILPALLAIGFFSISATTIDEVEKTDYCNWYTSKKNAKKNLEGFTYSSGKLNKFLISSTAQAKEVEVPLPSGNDYKFVFNSEGMPEKIKIEIFDKKASDSSRKLLFSNDDIGADQKQFDFEPASGTRKLYVKYTIPASEGADINACMLFLIGYK